MTRAEIFGANLKRILKEKGYTQKDAASLLNYSPASLSNIVNGQQEPTFEKIFEIADTLQISVLDLLGNNGYAPTEKFIIDRDFFEYRYNRALELLNAANVDAQKYGDNNFAISVPTTLPMQELPDGTLKFIPCINCAKINDEKSLVEIVELADKQAARQNIPFKAALSNILFDVKNTVTKLGK